MVVTSSALFYVPDKAPYSVKNPPDLRLMMFCSFDATWRASNPWQNFVETGSPNLVT